MKLSQLFIRSSTNEFFKEGRRTKNYSLVDFLHGYFYARWPYLYIGIGVGEHPVARWFGPLIGWIAGRLVKKSESRVKQDLSIQPEGDYIASHTLADTYHGKVVPLDLATQLVKIEQPIRVNDLEQVIPYPTARSIILKDPDHIVVLDCPCRAARKDPCQPLDVCLIVGEPFASFVIEHQKNRARWITQDEAVEILRQENERGHVHHAFFKDAMLQRFYAICNCCACCCGAMQAQRSGVPMLSSSGYVAKVDSKLCLACGTCEDNCQFKAVSVVDGISVVNEQACMGCGLCVSHCTQEAISLMLEPAKGLPLDMRLLMTSS